MNFYLLVLSIICIIAGFTIHIKYKNHEDEDVRMIGSTITGLGGTMLIWSIFGVVIALGTLVLYLLLTIRIRSYH